MIKYNDDVITEINVSDLPRRKVGIGRQGENKFRKVKFNVTDWKKLYPTGTVTISLQRPDGNFYPVVLNATGNIVEYTPTSADNAIVGDGWIEVRIVQGDVTGKSCKIPVWIDSALGDPGATPTEEQLDWIGQLVEATQETAVLAQQYASSAASSASAAEASASDAAESAELVGDLRDALKDGVVVAVEATTNSAGVHGITVAYDDGREKFIEVGANGMAFDGGYIDKIDEYGDESDNYYLHLTQEGDDVKGFTPFIVPATGGGGGAVGGTTMRLTSRMASKNFSVISTAQSCEILYSWSSVESDTGDPTGEGTETWYVNGARAKVNQDVPQGNRSFDLFADQNIRRRLTDGTANAIKLVIADSSGSTRTYTWNVTPAVYSLTWNAPEISNHGSTRYSVQLVPSGTGTKRLYVKVDNTFVQNGEPITWSGRSVTVDIPAQEHGAHTVLAWIEADVDGETISTEPLRHVGIWYKAGITTKIVAVYESEFEITQYSSHNVNYMVYDPATESATVDLIVTSNGVSTVQNSITVDRTMQAWAWRGNNTGEYTLTVKCGSVSADVSATVVGSEHSDIAPATEGQIMLLDPTGHSNSEAHPENFGYTDANGTNHPLTLSSNFNWVHGGFHTDSNGNTAFVVHRGTTAAFDTSLFTDTLSQNGKHIEIIFKTANVRDYEAKIMQSFADEGGNSQGVGIRLFANGAELCCKTRSLSVDYCEEELVEMCFDVEKGNGRWQRMKIWTDGTPSAAAACEPSLVTWRQDDQTAGKFVIGSEDADVWVYRIRVYNNNLQNNDILANYIADAPTADDVIGRYERNQVYTDTGAISVNALRKISPNLHIIQITASNFPTGKDNQVECNIEHWLGEDENHHFIAEHAGFVLQGTSSLNYIESAGNIDIDLQPNDGDKHKFDTVVKDGNGDVIENYQGYAMTTNSMPEKYFCLKVNTASSENANNACSTDWFNQFYPTESLAHSRDSRVRNAIEAHPCIILFTSSADNTIVLGAQNSKARTVAPGETILYAAGDMCNSKKTFNVFGQTTSVGTDSDGVPVFCVEYMDNSYDRCLYLNSDFSAETWKNSSENSNGQFEFRYPKKGTDAMKAKFIAMQNWVCGTNTAQATGDALESSVILYNPLTGVNEEFTNDTALYRGCRFRAELSNWFDVDGLIYYYVFTNYFLSVDQRAKNTFVSYEPDRNGVWKFNYSKYYDGDTILGINNKGALALSYGLEDTDTMTESGVSGNVYNAANSVLWVNIREYCADLCAQMYNAKEVEGCWSATAIQNKWNTYQRVRPETIMIDDYYNKYDRPLIENNTTDYLNNMMNGEKRSQRMHFLKYQEAYMSSKYLSENASGDAILLNIYSPSDTVVAPGTYFTITPYCDLYLTAKFGNLGAATVRAKKGEAKLVALRDSNGNIVSNFDNVRDKETKIYSRAYISDIQSMAQSYTDMCTIAGARKLRRLILGSTELGYQNVNLRSLNVAGAPLLEEINIMGLTQLTVPLDLSSCIFLEKFYATSSGLTGVKFAYGSGVKIVYLPNVSMLTAVGLTSLQTFNMGEANIYQVRVENSPLINTQSIVANATNIALGRMLDVNWTFQNADAVMKLVGKHGLDTTESDCGAPMILSGTLRLTVATEDELTRLRNEFSSGSEYRLTISADSIVDACNVTFYAEDGVTRLKDVNGNDYTQVVRSGESPYNPVAAGEIAAPTKQGDAYTGYTFSTWTNMSTDEDGLGVVTGATQYKAKFTSYTPTYTVTFWGQAGYAGQYLYRQENVNPGTAVYYTGSDLPDGADGSKWMGWDKNTNCVESDIDVFPVYLTTVAKSQVAAPSESEWAAYEYIYSDDYSDYEIDSETGYRKAAYTLQEFWSVLMDDNPTTHLKVGKKVKMLLGYKPNSKISDTTIELVLAGYNRFRESVEDKETQTGSLVHTFFLMADCLNATRAMNSSNSNAGGWPAMTLRGWLNNTLFYDLPIQWRQMIKTVEVNSTAGNQSTDIVYSNDKLFLPSYTEVGFQNPPAAPYLNEIDAAVYGSDVTAAILPIFSDATSRIKHTGGANGDATIWWLRSPSFSYKWDVFRVSTAGSDSPTGAGYRASVAFGFCI